MMKNRLTGQVADDVEVNADALLAAINEISESEVHRTLDDPQRASIDGRGAHTQAAPSCRHERRRQPSRPACA